MATIKIRGNSFNVVYTYKDEANKIIHHWETYFSEIDAATRKAYIDILQKNKDVEAIRSAALEYKKEKIEEKNAAKLTESDAEISIVKDKKLKTLAEFGDKFLPIYARKQRLSPGTYEGMCRNMRLHILPYFGDVIMNTITKQQVDEFIDHLFHKKCSGSKAYNKKPDEIPTLSTSSIKKITTDLNTALKTALEWGYIEQLPQIKAPTVTYAKRKFWDKEQVLYALDNIDDEILHLAVHLIFICSLRSGEALGLEIDSVDLVGKPSITIKQTLERLNDDAIEQTKDTEIFKKFPKLVERSKSSIVLKEPKTDASNRTIYITGQLAEEILQRIEKINRTKEFLGSEYNDHNLLLCSPEGNPIEPKLLERYFKKWQRKNSIEPEIEIQGLRKSSSMYKLRVNGNNYQEVQKDTGHTTPKILMQHYNDVLESERVALANKVQNDFYQNADQDEPANDQNSEIQELIGLITQNPEMAGIFANTIKQMQSMQ